MKRLALVLLALPLTACAASQQTAGNCDPRYPGYETCLGSYEPAASSHWQVVTGNGASLASPAEASVAGGPTYSNYNPH